MRSRLKCRLSCRLRDGLRRRSGFGRFWNWRRRRRAGRSRGSSLQIGAQIIDRIVDFAVQSAKCRLKIMILIVKQTRNVRYRICNVLLGCRIGIMRAFSRTAANRNGSHFVKTR